MEIADLLTSNLWDNTLMGVTIQNGRKASLTVTLPRELYEQVAAKAAELCVPLDKTIAVLLRYGLQVQSEREARIAELAEGLIASAGPDDIDATANQLGETIFRH